MPERLHEAAIDSRLATAGQQIDALLSEVEAIFDSVDYNYFAEVTDDKGNVIGIGKSLRPQAGRDPLIDIPAASVPIDQLQYQGLDVSYHVRLETPADGLGVNESWDYHWGSAQPATVNYSKDKVANRYRSSHTEGTHTQWPITPADAQANLPDLL